MGFYEKAEKATEKKSKVKDGTERKTVLTVKEKGDEEGFHVALLFS